VHFSTAKFHIGAYQTPRGLNSWNLDLLIYFRD